MDENAFRKKLAGEGYTETHEYSMEPNGFSDTHTHEWDACVLVLDGEFTLTTEADDGTCGVGDIRTLAAHEAHSEKAGPDGVRMLIGRRPAPA